MHSDLRRVPIRGVILTNLQLSIGTDFCRIKVSFGILCTIPNLVRVFMFCYYFIPFLTKFRSILFCSALSEPEIIDITDSSTFVFEKKQIL